MTVRRHIRTTLHQVSTNAVSFIFVSCELGQHKFITYSHPFPNPIDKNGEVVKTWSKKTEEEKRQHFSNSKTVAVFVQLMMSSPTLFQGYHKLLQQSWADKSGRLFLVPHTYTHMHTAYHTLHIIIIVLLLHSYRKYAVYIVSYRPAVIVPS